MVIQLKSKRREMRKILNKLLLFLFISCLPADFISADEYDLSEIIKEAQQNNSKIYNSIDNLKYRVHSRTYVYLGFTPFDINLVPFFEEYYADAYWEKQDSVRMDIYAMRVVNIGNDSSLTDSLSRQFSLPNPFLFDYNILSKNVGKDIKLPYYPFSEGAEKYYDYRLIGTLKSGMMDVISIEVTPKFIDVPAVEGSFMLDKRDSWIVASDFKYNDAAKVTAELKKTEGGFSAGLRISSGEEHNIRVKKSLYYSSFWLPELMEEDFFIYIWGLKVKVYRIIEFDSYVINIPKFETVKPSKKIEYSIDHQLQDSILTRPEYPGRLSKDEEEEILAKVEDTILSEKLFDDLGDLTKIAEKSAKESIKKKGRTFFKYGQLALDFSQYNRIEGIHIQYKYKFANPLIKNFATSIETGYGFKDKKFKWEIIFLKLFGKRRKFFIDSKIFDKLGFEEDTNLISDNKNSFTSLFLKTDYRDFYRKKGFSLGLGYKFLNNLGADLSFISQEENNVEKNTDFSIFRRKRPFRANPEIINGRYNGLQLSLKYNTYRINAESYITYTDKKFLKSDFSYSTYRFRFGWQYRLSYFSRFFFNLNGGFSSGEVAPQRWFDFGGKVFANYRGRLRGIDYKYFTGDKMLSSVLEYQVNGRVLEQIGIENKLINAIKFIFWNGYGWSSLSHKSRQLAINLNLPTATTDGLYYEIGLGISDILNIFRLDFIHNNIDNKITVGFNILR